MDEPCMQVHGVTTTSPFSVLLPKNMDSLGALAVPMTPSPPPLKSSQINFVVCAGLDVAVTHSFVATRQVVPPGGEVMWQVRWHLVTMLSLQKSFATCSLAWRRLALGLVRQLCTSRLGIVNKDKIRKVEKSFRSKNKKSDVIGKTSAAA